MEEVVNYNTIRKYLSKEKKSTNIIKIHMDTKLSISDLSKTLKYMSRNGELENNDNFDNIILRKR